MDEPIPHLSPLSAIEAARIANGYIAELAEKLGGRPERQPLGLLCECGCLGIVETTLADYHARKGAWLSGHSGEAAHAER